MSDFGDYEFDDEELAQGAGINKITEAYAKVFENIIAEATEGMQFAKGGASKEIAAKINKLTAKCSALVQISEMDTRIVGADGNVFNVFGEMLDEDDEENFERMDEASFEERLNDIINSCNNYTYTEASKIVADKKNIEDNGDHGDLDDISW